MCLELSRDVSSLGTLSRGPCLRQDRPHRQSPAAHWLKVALHKIKSH